MQPQNKLNKAYPRTGLAAHRSGYALLGVLILVLSRSPARSQQEEAPFAASLAADVFATALAFLAPRTLEPASVPQMTAWGLQGLTAIDPEMTVGFAPGSVRLIGRGYVVAMETPAGEDSRIWAELAAAVAARAAEISGPIRSVGTAGVIHSFFDELFNHLDPYSRYLPPRQAEADRAQRVGLADVGLSVSLDGKHVVVEDVTPEGPAASAGIRAGDRVLAIDGSPLRVEDPAAIAELMAGPENTIVAITIRSRQGRIHTFRLRRTGHAAQTVFAARKSDLLILRVSGFAHTTGADLARNLLEYLDTPHPPRGLIIDLRGNRGGLLHQAVDAAGLFLGQRLVAITSGRDPSANRILQSESADLSNGLPIVVVVDGRSASAAEILAAALADDGRAVVVGSTTLGKGLIQTVTTLPDGGELFVTWSRVLAPLGWPIQGLGVMPQVCTSLGAEALARERALLLQGIAPMAAALKRHHAARAPLPAAEILDIRNACPAAEGTDADLEAARFLIDHPPAYAAALLVAKDAEPP